MQFFSFSFFILELRYFNIKLDLSFQVIIDLIWWVFIYVLYFEIYFVKIVFLDGLFGVLEVIIFMFYFCRQVIIDLMFIINYIKIFR